MKSIKKVVQLWLDFMYGKKVNGARDHNPNRDGSWDAIDLMSYFFVNFNTAVTKVDTSRKKKKMERKQVVNTLVKSVKNIEEHYVNGHIIRVENNLEEEQT